MDVPIQYFQSVIAIELAVTGALLFQVRYFETRRPGEPGERDLPNPWLRLLVAVFLGATLIGCLDAMTHGGSAAAATAVAIGLALSVLPILIRVLPPLAQEGGAGERSGDPRVTIVALVLYALAVGALVLLLNR